MHFDKIKANPTKRLFINILTQDVLLKPAILDLIDNSIDSYTRKKFQDRRKIEIIANVNEFSIFDDCGGIALDILKEQVFRFGSKVDKLDNPTLGMYGIGLKRSIFKLGKKIKLETHDGVDYSLMDLNVTEWEKDDNSWEIPFETEKIDLVDQKAYTKISVSELTSETSNKLNSDVFINDLIETIKRSYCLIMKDNIDIYINNNKLVPLELYVSQDDNYKPSVILDNYDGISIRVICFIEPSKGTRLKNAINERGWNLFCNNRLILANDISELTGWKGSKDDMTSLPKYHSLFNEFRGMVFLIANNPFKLPLNTSKTGLNTENENYHYILNLMVKAARPIIDYIYEKNSKESEEIQVIEQQIADKDDVTFIAKPIDIINFNSNVVFKAPDVKAKAIPKATITYSKDKKLVETLMDKLNAGSYKEVGEKTFDYYMLNEM
ncbi:MAG: hypothetical protein JWP44_2130 [Mucilaginibacter sp.]|nr:hypothetical protein [Mucilaginibacter sp.]